MSEDRQEAIIRELIDSAYARLRGAAMDAGKSLRSPEVRSWIEREASVWGLEMPLQLKDLPFEFLEWLADAVEAKQRKSAP
jgi:hypothetical protein